MSEYSIRRLITFRAVMVLLISIFLILLVIIPINDFVSNKVYNFIQESTLKNISSSIEQFDHSVVVLGEAYNPALRRLLINYAENLKKEEVKIKNISDQQLSNTFSQVREKISLPDGLIEEGLKFYLISPSGEVIKSNRSSSLDRESSSFSIQWNKITNLEEGEVFLQHFTYSSDTGEPRKYGYIKLPEGYILELGAPLKISFLEKLSGDLRNLEEELQFVEELNLYNKEFIAVDKVFSNLREKDKEHFEDILQQTDKLKKVSLSSSKAVVYTCWNFRNNLNSSQSYFIKAVFDFSRINAVKRVVLIFIVLASILVGGIITFFSNSFYQKLVTPFSKLTESMQRTATEDIKELDVSIERTDIKEVNTLLATYQNMASELTASFEELEQINQKLEESYQEVESLNKRLEELLQIPEKIADSVFGEEKEFLSNLLHIANDLVPEADYGSVYLIEDGEWKYINTIGHDLESLKSLSLKEEYFLDFNDITFIKNKDLLKYNKERMPPEVFKEFAKASKPLKAALLASLRIRNELVGGISLDLAKESKQEFSKETMKIMNYFSNVASAFLSMHRYNKIQKKFQREMIFAIIDMLELHDKYTKGHSENVAEIAAAIARKFDFSPEKINQIYWTGLVHDIGKILIDKRVLNKPAELTSEEYNEVKKHSIWGHQVLSNSKELSEIALYIRHHHEKWDGTGYPDGLSGEEIPLISRIISVADAWDTMRSNRVYRSKLSKADAVEELRENKGKQFDPQVVEALLELISKGEI